MNKRINWIDWAKSLGIFLVVIGHMYYPENLQYPKYLIYGFHMPFFFFISGFLHRQETNFLKKNIQKLIIPYLIFNLIIFSLFNIPCYLLGESNKLDLIILIKNTVFGLPYSPSGSCWFLLALFWAKIANHYLLKLQPLFAIILSILTAILGYVIFHYIYFRVPFFFCQGLLATPIVTIGYFLKKFNIIDLVFNKKWVILFSCFIFIPIYSFLAYKLKIFGFVDCNLTYRPFYGIIMTAIGCYLFIMFCRTLNKYSNRFIQQISVGTITVLAFHLDIYRTFLKLYSSTPNIIISIIACCLIMTICYFIIGFIQKNNILSYLLLGKSNKNQPLSSNSIK